ncbi:MAG: ankyrin repeat domain-containing protein [Alphaproteobacteria bacterium]|nr:MAG: ankyrin repeat domain-containing protein [Alphaproteobacteria bacterium]
MTTISKELKELFAKINSTADFCYVEFSDVNTTNALGENALHIAVRWGEIDAVKLLISSGADINKHGEYGYTPLHYAAECGYQEIVKLLLDSGANPFARTEGDIPSTLARFKDNKTICDLLDEYMRKSPYRPKGWIFSGEDLINRKD